MKLAGAIITNRGGRTCHAAIVARELGIPAFVGTETATQVLTTGQEVTVNCAQGDIASIYAGLLPFIIQKYPVDKTLKTRTKLLLNSANPDLAFELAELPSDGAGLVRLEFIINNSIGIHPNAVLNNTELPAAISKKIAKLSNGYANPQQFYIEKLSQGIATIAAAFYPKPAIVRFSDFKSNEYASLLAGNIFEPKEENPMIGFRGASRYPSKQFREFFRLECEAINRVRNDMGLLNVKVMLPFVRTVEELLNTLNLIIRAQTA